MSSKSSSTAKRSNQSAFSRRRPKAASRHLTSEIIADDIAAFIKRGGHIEVLGNSPYRPHVATTTSRSSAKSKHKSAPAKAAKNKARG